jgi:alkylation response protein AidB-like acyl-CoA dehydrogenase
VVREIAAADPLHCVDPSVRLLRVTDASEVARVADERLVTRARLLLAAELLGIAEATLDQSVEYAKDREQFGKPIGVHQAVKHRCADEMVRCWSTRAQLFYAGLLFDAERPEWSMNAAAAITLAREAARLNVAANVHNHGGIGVTAEHTAGNYVKRAHICEKSLGDLEAVTLQLLETEAVAA